MKIDFDTQTRSILVSKLLVHLEHAVSGSRASLRGSLAENRADIYSDIDILWEVPDDEFSACLIMLEKILDEVEAVESMRSDPDYYYSTKRRLIFVRFTNMPVFWRLDLAIFAVSLKGDQSFDENNPSVRGGWENWSLPESALMNVIAAIKAIKRGQPSMGQELLNRAYSRLSLKICQTGFTEQIYNLLDLVKKLEPDLEMLTQKVRDLTEIL